MHSKFYDEKNPIVTLSIKDYGDVVIELFPDVAPNTVKNFVNLVQDGYYDGSIFHRVIKGFMIQGGRGSGDARSIRGEFTSNGHNNPLKHTKGVISMARTQNPNSASSQFFIMHESSPHLDGDYASFGVVKKGIELIDKIALVNTNAADMPHVDVVIEDAEVDTKGLSYPIAKHM